MDVELGRVLARLEESGGVPNACLGGESACELLGALAVVDPKKVDVDAAVSDAAGVAVAS